jgi:hypothetical protein
MLTRARARTHTHALARVTGVVTMNKDMKVTQNGARMFSSNHGVSGVQVWMFARRECHWDGVAH